MKKNNDSPLALVLITVILVIVLACIGAGLSAVKGKIFYNDWSCGFKNCVIVQESAGK